MAASGSSMGAKGKLTTGETITLAGAAAFLLSVFIFNWYKVSVSSTVPGFDFSESVTVSSKGGLTVIAIILAIVAIAEILARVFGGMKVLPDPGLVHLIIAGVSLVIVALRILLRPSVPGADFAGLGVDVSVGITIGIFISLVLAAVWTYGAYMLKSEPASSSMSSGSAPAAPATPPPPPSDPIA